jgi:phosphoribosylformylglycinamidine synthase subunit PurQ / glutaminase
MKVGVVVFPGSNCDHDMQHIFGHVIGAKTELLWHKEREIGKCDLLVIPGGFSYGDYLRTGALAKLSPVMESVREFAAAGGPVLGICNGFQILCEAGLLPGALLQNIGMRFLSQFVHIKAENNDSIFTHKLDTSSVITCPVAHGEGNYYASAEELERIEGDGQVLFRYCSKTGEISNDCRKTNPNGSLNSIAGITNKKRNVMGMMPHPERASESLIGLFGNCSAKSIFDSLAQQLK